MARTMFIGLTPEGVLTLTRDM